MFVELCLPYSLGKLEYSVAWCGLCSEQAYMYFLKLSLTGEKINTEDWLFSPTRQAYPFVCLSQY